MNQPSSYLRPVPPPRSPHTSHTFGLTALGILFVLLIVAVFDPMFSQGSHCGRDTSCLSNIKQLSVSMLIYLSDSDDRLPAKNWCTATYEYVKNPDVYNCPAIKEKKGGYAMNKFIAGADANKLPPNTLLLFETAKPGLNVMQEPRRMLTIGRHGIKRAIAYLDSRAKAIKPQEQP